MESKHTPGPWKVSTNNKGQSAIIAYGQVCLLESAQIVYMTDGEHDANCALIAAAPDMLNALEAAQAALLGQGLSVPLVDTILKKAKGEL